MIEKQQLSEQESLGIIQQMIATAKKEQKDDGTGWILWGWMLLAASILTIVNLRQEWVSTFFFWNAFGTAAIVIKLGVITRRMFVQAPVKVRTYTSELFKKLDAGFFISLFVIILSMNLTSMRVADQDTGTNITPIINAGFALLINLYAFWILIYGAALNFKPSVIGAYLTWGIGIAALFADKFEHVMWLHTVAVICGYIIPGHIAYKAFYKTNSVVKAERV